MYKSILATFLILSSSLLLAGESFLIRSSDFNRPQEIQSRDGNGSLFVTIKSASVRDLENGRVEATVNYEIRNSLGVNIERYKVEFELENSDRRKIAEVKEKLDRLASGATHTDMLIRDVKTKRPSSDLNVSAVKVEIEDVYPEDSGRKIRF
jgi:hypothetical protein